NIEKFKDYDHRNVVVNCLWDNEKLHDDMIKPMFCSWKETVVFSSSLLHALITDEKKISRSSMRHMLASIQANDLLTPMETLVNERRKTNASMSGPKKYYYSVYRDLLFLSFVAIGTENIDHMTFDREYRRAYDVITSRQQNVLSSVDKPPSVGAIFCRRFFKRLKLKPTIAHTTNICGSRLSLK
ncbi:C-myc promoter-binding protein-like protein, partial [Leptotrombidium deliense]